MTDPFEEEDDHRTPIEFFDDGFREFSEGLYFEAHDTWEEFWHRLRGPDRRFLQALIHLAVGAYHYENGNTSGARSQWGKCRDKLRPYPEGHWGVDASEWITWIEAYLADRSLPPFPPALRFKQSEFPPNLTMAAG
ncbi:MAG: DUF309 domain-containing protein [candidate division Zixibacteria bacterium]|nr:DUF309 domain-containing protein [candidate division Zixibacteria bacterium]